MNGTIRIGDREVARIGLGTNRLTETPANIGFIRAAVEAGIGMIDSAHLYTGGASERTIGAALAGTTRRPIVATKGGFGRGEGKRNGLAHQIEQSLSALRVDRIDLYYLHRVDPDTPLEESVALIAEFRAGGKIDQVGLSQVGVAEIQSAQRIVPISAVQNQFNLAARGWDEVVDYCTSQGIAFVPFFPLRGARPGLADIARRHDASPSQVILAWLLRRSPQMLPIPGTLSMEHVRENVAALEIELCDAEFASLS
ncbi:MAG TPA: aldo/keto reductase [Candidatus Limnocylindrales bacterium]